ncbi:MAG: hypothetical protein AAF412_05640 [Pseudomonadota bacterium]
MENSPIDLQELRARLGRSGLVMVGDFIFEPEHVIAGRESLIGSRGLLIGNAGPDMWRMFRQSSEFDDGEVDPMNRWTARKLGKLAAETSSSMIFPFEKPYWPFQRFLKSAADLRQSPLGLYIHAEYGLWHGLRGVLIVARDRELIDAPGQTNSNADSVDHPCVSCDDKPCLTACPANAFFGDSLNVGACFKHIDSKSDPDCMVLGCASRSACPVGKEHTYDIEQIRFHMNAYRF